MLPFSLAPSRLEHYSLPALPAVALLGGARLAAAARRASRPPRVVWLGTVAAGLLGGGAFGAVWGREHPRARLLDPRRRRRLHVARAADARSCWPGRAAPRAGRPRAATARTRRRDRRHDGSRCSRSCCAPRPRWSRSSPGSRWPSPSLARLPDVGRDRLRGADGVSAGGWPRLLHRAPASRSSSRRTSRRRRISSRCRDATLHLPRPEFARRWTAATPLAFVSDPQRRRPTPDGLVPGPFHIVDRSVTDGC